MSFVSSYPKLGQWLSHGGKMLVRPSAEGGIEVFLGDAGGFPQDPPSLGPDVEAALLAAESEVSEWLVRTQRLQQELLSDPIPELQHKEFICVTGWPPARNPRYQR